MKDELEKLLEFKDGKLMIEGQDLVEVANMYKLSVPVFMYLLQMNLCTKKVDIYERIDRSKNNDIIITNIKEKRYLAPFDLRYEESYVFEGEVLVPSNRYEEIKEKVFNFAYEKCSNRVNPLDKWTEIIDLSKDEFLKVVSDDYFEEYYMALYPSIHNHWKAKISGSYGANLIKLNTDKEKRYSLIKK